MDGQREQREHEGRPPDEGELAETELEQAAGGFIVDGPIRRGVTIDGYTQGD